MCTAIAASVEGLVGRTARMVSGIVVGRSRLDLTNRHDGGACPSLFSPQVAESFPAQEITCRETAGVVH